MKQGFWQKLPRPFFGLAPMADVTDAPFRQIIASLGKLARRSPGVGGADVFWTEFTSADGLMSAGRHKLLINLLYSENERPIVAQIFSSSPLKIEGASRLAAELGFDGVDINMGCPDRAIEKQGAGAALIKNPKLARQLIKAAKKGAPELPISVKTRLGYNSDILKEWLPELLAEEPAAITIHARTRKEMSKTPARWERIKKAVEIRNEFGSKTLIIGNGDVADMADARKKAAESGADGVMLGRAIFGNPWLFSDYKPSQEDRLRILVKHSQLFEELLKGHKSFSVMKKHFKAYLRGFDGAKELRLKLMEAENAKEVGDIVNLALSVLE